MLTDTRSFASYHSRDGTNWQIHIAGNARRLNSPESGLNKAESASGNGKVAKIEITSVDMSHKRVKISSLCSRNSYPQVAKSGICQKNSRVEDRFVLIVGQTTPRRCWPLYVQTMGALE
jgi:hypothetical protein